MVFRKIQKILLFLLLILVPTNLGKHFVFNFSYVIGSLIDYQIPTLYLTDVIMFLLFALYAFELKVDRDERQRFIKSLKTGSVFFIIFFLLVSLPNIDTRNLPVAWYKWLRLLQYSFFAFYISLRLDFLKNFNFLINALSLAVIYESLLAIMQWRNQGSVFGYYFLGESVYDTSTITAPLANYFGKNLLRSYGTCPHPNVLGGFLAFALPLVLVAFLYTKSKSFRLCYLSGILLGLFGLFFSFSRTAWISTLLGFIGCLIYFFYRKKRWPSSKPWLNFLSVASFLSILGSLSIFIYIRLGHTLSAIQRYQVAQIAVRMFLTKPLFGVGLGNFPVRLEEFGRVTSEVRFLQPVHSIYLLIAAELGIFGILGFLGVVAVTIKGLIHKTKENADYGYLCITLAQLFLMGFFDHYLFTLPQGLLIFFLVLGMGLKTR